MGTGAITGYIDVAQVTLYVFWFFFAGLIFYLRREDKREGYPLVSERSEHVLVQGFPSMPKPKTFLLRNGHTYQAPPGHVDERELKAVPAEPWPGAPLKPTGNPMIDGIGAASYALREDVPELTAEDQDRTVPLRVATDFMVAAEDVSPIGMAVYGADGVKAGVVTEVWIDRSEPMIRYLETELPLAEGARTVLVPMNFCRMKKMKGEVHVASILASQFATVPALATPDRITAREEDKITGYFGGGTIYATPERAEPII
ncbi:photosynthetic reaction center subunit H [Salinarimonas ramus]|uniref:Photosynthetic reaction center subunit H n=1 Tax=Salinarimonas ramus TaxID=690164 RepID=A0A917QK71_9HYPH|nr:photosynthetic reaction center subunit H [Salinarimonas ramus]GGK54962.1 photosynthetic reaction center subunit H [Salinarimonas ramus]